MERRWVRVRWISIDLGSWEVVSLPRQPQAKGFGCFMGSGLGGGKGRGAMMEKCWVLSQSRGRVCKDSSSFQKGVSAEAPRKTSTKVPQWGGLQRGYLGQECSYAWGCVTAWPIRGAESLTINPSKTAVQCQAPNLVCGGQFPHLSAARQSLCRCLP